MRKLLGFIIILASLSSPALAQVPLAVTAVELTPSLQSRTITMTGTVEAQEIVPVAFKAAGRISALEVDLGDRVTIGDVIARLEPTQAAEIQRAAAAQLAASEAAATQAEQAFARARDLLARGAGRQADLDAAEQGWLAAAARRDEAQAGLVKAQQALDDMVLHAPISGVITERSAQEGQIAIPGQTLVAIAAHDAREAVFAIPSVPMSVPLLDVAVDVVLLDDPDRRVTGVISEVSPLTDAATGTVTLRVTLPDSGDLFGLGAAVSARFEIATANVLSVPAAALARQGDGPAVWVIDPDTRRVSLRPVGIGRYGSYDIEITSGVEAGEQIVVDGAHLLFTDREVAPQEVQQ